MRIIDSHCHLTDAAYDADRDAVLARARAAGVAGFLAPGCDSESNQAAAALAAAEPDVWAAVGIHPDAADQCDAAALDALRELLAQPRVAAVGEIGLDYHWDTHPRETQRQALRMQLALAREVNCPVILHNREADADLLAILREVGLPEAGGVLHCFSGDAQLAETALALGLMISFAGQLTFKNAAALRETAAGLPLAHLLVETDSPYLTPAPYRGRRNEPARVVEVAGCLAALHGVSPEEVAAITAANATRLFRME